MCHLPVPFASVLLCVPTSWPGTGNYPATVPALLTCTEISHLVARPISTPGLAGAALRPSIMHRMGVSDWLGPALQCLKFQQLAEVPGLRYLETRVRQPRVRVVGSKIDEQHTRCPPPPPYNLAHCSRYAARVPWEGQS